MLAARGSASDAQPCLRLTVQRVRDFSCNNPPAEEFFFFFFFNAVDRHGHMLVVLVVAVVCRWVPGSLGCLRRTWRADASDRAGDVCSRKPLAFDEGRRGRGWRVRATVASPHRITAAISSRLSVPPSFFLPPSPLSFFFFFKIPPLAH